MEQGVTEMNLVWLTCFPPSCYCSMTKRILLAWHFMCSNLKPCEAGSNSGLDLYSTISRRQVEISRTTPDLISYTAPLQSRAAILSAISLNRDHISPSLGQYGISWAE
jgi:hypothetical protein